MSKLNSIAIRLSDIAISGVALLCAAPVLLGIALLIYLSDYRSPFFLQERLGKDGTPLRIIKFRTMSWSASSDVSGAWAADNDPRVTKIGRVLRIYHLDELPQLMNVLGGSMSLVGPRPFRRAVHEAIAKIEPRWDKRLACKPGITGFAQLSIQKGETLEDHASKIDWDLSTIGMTFFQYWGVVLRTPLKIVSGNSH